MKLFIQNEKTDASPARIIKTKICLKKVTKTCNYGCLHCSNLIIFLESGRLDNIILHNKTTLARFFFFFLAKAIVYLKITWGVSDQIKLHVRVVTETALKLLCPIFVARFFFIVHFFFIFFKFYFYTNMLIKLQHSITL